ncbi:V-type ATP synthase subunit I [bacterium]|nr:V-type ATP synthase subunit I [bacterium]
MANSRVKRIELLLHKNQRAEVLATLADAGAVELEPAELEQFAELEHPDGERAKVQRKNLSRIKDALEYLERFAPKLGFLAGMSGRKVTVDSSTLKEYDRHFNATEVSERVLAVEARENELTTQLARLNEERELVASWSNLTVPPGSLGESDSTVQMAYSLNRSLFASLREQLTAAAGELYEFAPLSKAKDSGQFLLVWHKSVNDDFRTVLKGFDPAPCPLSGSLTPQKQLLRLEEEIASTRSELEATLKEANELLEHLEPLYLSLDKTDTHSQGEGHVALALATEETIYLRGWVPEIAITGVKQILKRLDLAYYEFRDPTAEEDPPIYLHNVAPIRPFEMVTDLYGRPNRGESDPTPFFAFFFALFFGICLTDAGYGFLLAGIAGLMLWKMPLAENSRKMMKMMIIAGFFTMVVGLLTGGIFGLDFRALNIPEVADFLDSIEVVNPLKPGQMFNFFYLSLGLGYAHLLIGYLIGFFEALKQKDKNEAFFRKLPWALVMILIAIAVGLPMLTGGDATWAWYALIAVGVYVLLFSGVGDNSGLPRIGAGFFNLYSGLSGLFSDVLSYARLFALGLATGVIASVVNTMAFDSSAIGMVIILVVGHLFNLAMNALGAFIHTARLQFVEFFGKFYEGGGRTFAPYAHSINHTVLKK